MNQLNKGKAKYSSVWVLALLVLSVTLYYNAVGYQRFYFHSFLTADTVPVRPAAGGDSARKANESSEPLAIRKGPDTTIVVKTDTFGFRSSRDSLDAPVTYHADDSMVMDIPAKKILLYGKETRVNYLDNKLVSPRIEFDQRTNLVKAYLIKDSNGNVINFPKFNQADFKTQSDSIWFNMKTGKGLTKGTYMQQGEIFVIGERIKKVDANTFYALRGKFTTCNLDTPHFAFVSKKIKFINKKMAITGPVHPEFEDVPIPVVLPFGIYPLSQGRHSGILAPTFNANEQLGLALDGLGYYKVLNDKWDVILRGTLYSYGGWTANISPRYFK